jgi:hypothetical protein
MSFSARFGLAFLAVAVASGLPTLADHRRALGVVVQTDRGHIDTTNAVTGADIYSCDVLATDEGGVLRVAVGASQIFLSASSTAALEDEGGAVQALATAGTLGFVLSPAADLSVRTPAGTIRAAGSEATSGQVTYHGTKELIVSAIHGDLTLDSGGQLRDIPEGKSAVVTFDDNLGTGCHTASALNQGNRSAYSGRKIGFYLLVGGAIAIPSYIVWHVATESQSAPAK